MNEESDENSSEEDDEEDLHLYEPEYVIQLDSWLAFKGDFDSMQALTRLRFKLMSYFLNMLKKPSNETSEENLVFLFFIYFFY